MYDKPTCRLCLSTEGNLVEIFDSLDMPQKIFECTNIEIKNTKGLPSCICEICKSEIIIWLKFKNQCIKTDELLKNKYPELFIELEDYEREKIKSDPLSISRKVDDDDDDDGDSYYDIEKHHDIDEDSRSEEMKVVEYVEDIDCNNSSKDYVDKYTDEEDESQNNGHVKILNVKFEKLLDDDYIEDYEHDLQSDNTVQIISIRDEDEHFQVESLQELDKTDLKEQNIKILGEKAKSRCGEVWKINDGKRIRYHTKCEICGKLQQNIKQHMLVHTNEMPFKCPYCKRGFRQKSNFKHHIYIHTGEKPYKCKLCEKAFSDPASVRSHLITHHTGERRYHCEICGKSFGRSHTLAAHRRIHTQDRRHACEYCSKKFLSKHSLKKHIRTHTGERPYQCDQCPKNFSTSGNLTTHKRVHSKERPYQCLICGLDFAYKSVLKIHMKRHMEKKLDDNVKNDNNEDEDDEDNNGYINTVEANNKVIYKIEFNTIN